MQQIDKKEFALAAIAPYYKDPSICGYENKSCQYQTADGKKCVAGKFMLETHRNHVGGIEELFSWFGGQKGIFLPSAVDILSDNEWGNLQDIHDAIADPGNEKTEIEFYVNELGLFTMDELIDYSKKL